MISDHHNIIQHRYTVYYRRGILLLFYFRPHSGVVNIASAILYAGKTKRKCIMPTIGSGYMCACDFFFSSLQIRSGGRKTP